MRVLHCLRAPVGGLFRHVRDLAAAQAGYGLDVGVVCDAASADRLTEERLAALKPHLSLGMHQVPMSRGMGWRDVTAYAAVRDVGAMQGAHVLHGHGAKGGAYARLSAHALRASGRSVRCYYTPHGGTLHYDPDSLEGRFYIGLERRLAPMTHGMIFESRYAARVYGARICAPACPLRVIPNGVSAADFSSHEAREDAADFLFVGELRRLKGVDVLLSALAELRRDYPVGAAIVGDGPDAAELKAFAQYLGIDREVRFLGPMPAAEAFSWGKVLVVPSRSESFPYIVLEAGAAGIPLIATNAGGIPDIVAGTNTPLVPPDDPAALGAVMRAVLAAPDLALSRARRLSTRVAQHFTTEAMADAITEFYGHRAPLTAPAPALTVA